MSPPVWDFSSARALLNTFYPPPSDIVESFNDSVGQTTSATEISAPSVSPKHGTRERDPPQLGNFDNVWSYLGVPLDASPPVFHTPADRGILTSERLQTADFGSSPSKGVTWQDGLDSNGARNGSLSKLPAPSSPPNKLSKKQRKRLNQQLKRAASETRNFESSSSSEDDEEPPVSQVRKSSDRHEVIQQYIHNTHKSPKSSTASNPTPSLESPAKSPATVRYHLRNRDILENSFEHKFQHNERIFQDLCAANQALAAKRLNKTSVYMNEAQAEQQAEQPQPLNQQRPTYQTPQKTRTNGSFDPQDYWFSPQDPRTPSRAAGSQSRALAAPQALQAGNGSSTAIRMYEKTMEQFNNPAHALRNYYRTLLTDKLAALFLTEREYLTRYYSERTLQPHGIHVFVDASNVSSWAYHMLLGFCLCPLLLKSSIMSLSSVIFMCKSSFVMCTPSQNISKAP